DILLPGDGRIHGVARDHGTGIDGFLGNAAEGIAIVMRVVAVILRDIGDAPEQVGGGALGGDEAAERIVGVLVGLSAKEVAAVDGAGARGVVGGQEIAGGVVGVRGAEDEGGAV